MAQGKLPSHVELKFSAPPTVSYYFDPHILNPALLNLVSNGVDACEAREKGVIEVFIQLREDDILIGVRDNGLGIPPEIQNRVWDAYFTTKDVDKGTGLGLWMVQRAVVMDHKGRVWFESGETGTTFYISLPQKKGEQDGNREKDTTY